MRDLLASVDFTSFWRPPSKNNSTPKRRKENTTMIVLGFCGWLWLPLWWCLKSATDVIEKQLKLGIPLNCAAGRMRRGGLCWICCLCVFFCCVVRWLYPSGIGRSQSRVKQFQEIISLLKASKLSLLYLELRVTWIIITTTVFFKLFTIIMRSIPSLSVETHNNSTNNSFNSPGRGSQTADSDYDRPKTSRGVQSPSPDQFARWLTDWLTNMTHRKQEAGACLLIGLNYLLCVCLFTTPCVCLSVSVSLCLSLFVCLSLSLCLWINSDGWW